jgi:hypothetical protein
MNTIKKKIFTKATFLFLALMLMLAPMTVGAFTAENDGYGLAVIDDCCAQDFLAVEIEGETIVVTMSTACGRAYCSQCQVTIYFCVSSCNDHTHKNGHGPACR